MRSAKKRGGGAIARSTKSRGSNQPFKFTKSDVDSQNYPFDKTLIYETVASCISEKFILRRFFNLNKLITILFFFS